MAKEKALDTELYSFEVKDFKEVEEKTVTKDDKTGEETTVTKKVKKEVPVRIVIKRPNARQVERADVEYSKKLSELMKLGILTRAMVTKKYNDTGGVLTEAQSKELLSWYKRLGDIQKDFVYLSMKGDNATAEEAKKLSDVKDEITTLRRGIANVESEYSYIFQHTSDIKASNHVVLWYSLMLSYIEEQKDGGEPTYVPFYAGDTFEERLDSFYDKEDNATSFYLTAKRKLAYFITFWYNGGVASKDDFVALEKDIDDGKV